MRRDTRVSGRRMVNSSHGDAAQLALSAVDVGACMLDPSADSDFPGSRAARPLLFVSELRLDDSNTSELKVWYCCSTWL